MIDQAARRRLAEGVRHLANGRITNDEFEDQYGRAAAASTDPGVRAVFWQGAWGDVSKLTDGVEEVSGEVATSAVHAALRSLAERVAYYDC